MVERPLQKKQDEQYPLLKVDGGGGDGTVNPQSAPTLAPPPWGVTCTPKQSWFIRWPEYVSTCWMTIILLGISCLVFYALGMEAYRRQPVLLIKCNGSRPASDVFYHQIVPRGGAVPIMLYTDYLSSMAYQYPSLQFHVYFLIDDSIQTLRGIRQPRFINTLIPVPLSTYPLFRMDETTKRELAEFSRTHPNVNVTIMALSKYMAFTPLRYKWRIIPLPSLSFYARVFSVWQYGGVGMDLCTFNNNFNTHQQVDRRISAILKQHNDGIKPEEYKNALNKIDREEENEFLSMFCGMIHSILNETRAFLTKSILLPQIAPEKDSSNEPLIRIHRNKRELSNEPFDPNNGVVNSPVVVDILNSTNATELKKNEYQTFDNAANINSSRTALANGSTESSSILKANYTGIPPQALNKSDHAHVVLFYDFSMITDGGVPSFIMPDSIARTEVGQPEKEKQIINDNNGMYGLLSLDSNGLFIAASSKIHPFLGQLITAGCQRRHPKCAIQDTIVSQCSGIMKEDTYCNNIYVL